MSGILDMLTEQLGGDAVRQISRQIGADEGATAAAIQSALPVLVGALAKNAAQPQGAEALKAALERDHDGSILDDLVGAFTGGGGGMGEAILGHVLGGRRSGVEAGLSQASGLDGRAIAQLLAMLAPLVMGALGKAQRQGGFDVGGLAGMLRGEQQQARARQGGGGGGLLASFLDSDGDGEVSDDLARMGAGLLGNLLKR